MKNRMRQIILAAACGLSFLAVPRGLWAQENQLGEKKEAASVECKKGFLDCYWFLLSPSDEKAFKNLKTDIERQAFIEQFWKDRDPDPNTPENERKIETDQWIKDVEEDTILLRNTDVDFSPTTFREGGGPRGEMARIYLLHGMPDFKAKLPEGQRFVELMMWTYGDGSGHIKYNFLFYKKYGMFKVFRLYGMGLETALQEISNRFGPQDPDYINQEWYEFQAADIQRIFQSALFQFSDYSKMNPDEAMKPPTPAALLVEQSGSGVLGDPIIPPGWVMRWSTSPTSLPVRFRISGNKGGIPLILLKYSDVDWREKENEFELVLKLRIFFQNKETKQLVLFKSDKQKEKVPYYERWITKKAKKNELLANPDAFFALPLVELGREIENFPAGTYRVNIYLRHEVTNKDAAFVEEIVKK